MGAHHEGAAGGAATKSICSTVSPRRTAANIKVNGELTSGRSTSSPRVALFCLQLALLKPGQRDGPQQRVSGQRNHRRGPAVARLANRVLRGAELVDARLRWVVNGASRGRVERPQQPGSRPPVRAA